MFFNHWNGISLLRSATTFFDYHIYTHISGSWALKLFLLVFGSSYVPWPMEWLSVNIIAKELVPIIISYAVCGPLLKQESTEFHCDNQSLVVTINKGSSKDAMVMHLLRCLWFFIAVFDINIRVPHTTGKFNNAANMLSRTQTETFLKAHSHMPTSSTPWPPSLLHLLSLQMLDWISSKFHRLFQKIYIHAWQHFETQKTV